MTPRLLPTASITDPRLRMKAIGLMVLATMCFAGLDATAKYLVTAKAVPVWQVTWLRFVGHIAFSAVVGLVTFAAMRSALVMAPPRPEPAR